MVRSVGRLTPAVCRGGVYTDGAALCPRVCPLPRLRSAGAKFDALEVFQSPTGYGVRATRAIAVGETFVTVPRRVTMEEASARADPVFGPIAADVTQRLGKGGCTSPCTLVILYFAALSVMVGQIGVKATPLLSV